MGSKSTRGLAPTPERTGADQESANSAPMTRRIQSAIALPPSKGESLPETTQPRPLKGESAALLRPREAPTLGDLLFADPALRPTSEEDWVELVRSIAAGDQHALRSLYERMQRIVFTLIVRITNDRETAEEVMLDVFHDVWRRASRYDPTRGPVVGWIMNQARCRAIDRLRFEQRKKRVGPHAGAPPSATDNGAEEMLALVEKRRLLRVALRVLTPQERHTIEAAFFSELTHRQVADSLRQPLGTVKTRIRSGLQKLREALAGGVAGP